MATTLVNPAWVPTAKRLKQAITAAKADRQKIAARLGVHYGTVSNFCTGRALPSPEVLAKLRTLLRLDAETVAGIEALNAARGGGPARGPSQGGPARRAVALHAARQNAIAVLPPAPSAPSAPSARREQADSVFGMEMKSDGTMSIWMRATLPFDKGTTLLRALLDMNIIEKGDAAHDNVDDGAGGAERDR